MDQKLSGQRAALARGQNPLPLYSSLNVKENSQETLDFKGMSTSTLKHNAQYTQHMCTQGTYIYTHTQCSANMHAYTFV